MNVDIARRPTAGAAPTPRAGGRGYFSYPRMTARRPVLALIAALTVTVASVGTYTIHKGIQVVSTEGPVRPPRLPVDEAAAVTRPGSPPLPLQQGGSRCDEATDCVTCLFVGTSLGGEGGTVDVARRSEGGARCGWCAAIDKCVSLSVGTTPPPGAPLIDTLLSPRGIQNVVGGGAPSGGIEDNPINNHGTWYCESRPTAEAPSSCRYCADMEQFACPAVLHTHIPTKHRVLHVAIRKGGPEALVQLHLALNDWGFNTTLDTRKSKKEKGGPVVPFFMESYRDEFARAPPLRWSANYDHWHESSEAGDLLIGTETWGCRSTFKNTLMPPLPNAAGQFSVTSLFPTTGIRQMQWHLTVWPRRDRSACTIVGHTDYVTFDYMHQSRRALLFPYISPHILRLAAATHLGRDGDAGRTSQQAAGQHNGRRRGSANELSAAEQEAILAPQYSLAARKEPLVLFDSDTKLTNDDLKGSTEHDTKIATGYAPQQLYALYAKAKAGVDLRLPGGERFIYEASLFDVCVIVDSSLNGGNQWDFPIPDSFKPSLGEVSYGTGGSKVALVAAVDKCVREHASLFPAVPGAPQPFNDVKRHVLLQRPRFYRHVRRYFSNSVRIVTYSANLPTNKVIAFVLAALTQIPLAVVDVLFPTSSSLKTFLSEGHDMLKQMGEDSLLAAVAFRVVGDGTVAVDGSSSVMDALQADIRSAGRQSAATSLAARTWGDGTAGGGLAAKSSLFLLALPVDTVVVGGAGAVDGESSEADAIHMLGTLRTLVKKRSSSSSAVLLSGPSDVPFLFGTVSDVIAALRSQPSQLVSVSPRLAKQLLASTSAVDAATSKFLCLHKQYRRASPESCAGTE